MKKSIPNNYTYESFLKDFNISLEIFNRFNDTRKDSYTKKKLTQCISKEITKFTYIEEKIQCGFKAIRYLNNVKGNERLAKMDFLYKGNYLFKDVPAQVLIFVIGTVLNNKYNKNYNYSTINEFYKFFTERKDRGPWKNEFDNILADFVKIDSEFQQQHG